MLFYLLRLHRSWSANQVIGAPNVYPAYGDTFINAWCPNKFSNYEYIIVSINEHTVYSDLIMCYESFDSVLM